MSEPTTLVYSRIGDLDIHLDLYLPILQSPEARCIPAVIFFHGGGIFRGSRKSILPEFKDDVISKGWAFISADYRLLLPSTGFDILEDITALFTYISSNLPQIDPYHLFVAGHSGGAYVAHQAGLHGNPKPKALFALSGQGGALLTPHYFTPKPHLQKKNLGIYKKYSNPDSAEFKSLQPCSDFPWSWRDAKKVDVDVSPGARKWLSDMASLSGTRLDFLTGIPELCKVLRSAFAADENVDLDTLIPDDVKILFPELQISASFPPSFLVHGTGDRSVMMAESEKIAKSLGEFEVECKLVLVKDWGHGYNAGVYERWIKDVIPFFEKQIT